MSLGSLSVTLCIGSDICLVCGQERSSQSHSHVQTPVWQERGALLFHLLEVSRLTDL